MSARGFAVLVAPSGAAAQAAGVPHDQHHPPPVGQVKEDEERTAVDRTPRQRILDLLRLGRMTARRLAEVVGISERQVEEHVAHLLKSLAHDRSVRFVLEPSECQACGFVFRERRRVTRPSRCPKCRSQAITRPRSGVESRAGKHR